MPVDRVPDALVRVFCPLPAGPPARRVVPQLGPPDAQRRAAGRARRRRGCVVKRYRLRERDERHPRAARQGLVLGARGRRSSTPSAASSAAPASPSARPTRSASTRTPTCPSSSRCAPAARCAGTSAPGAASATRRCGHRRPRSTVTTRSRRPRCGPTRPTPTGRSPAARRPTGSARCSSATPSARPPATTTPRTAARSPPS